MSDQLRDWGIGYTLATGRLFCDVGEFHQAAEQILGRPVWTHEFADKATWAKLREAFEVEVTEQLGPLGPDQDTEEVK